MKKYAIMKEEKHGSWDYGFNTFVYPKEFPAPFTNLKKAIRSARKYVEECGPFIAVCDMETMKPLFTFDWKLAGGVVMHDCRK